MTDALSDAKSRSDHTNRTSERSEPDEEPDDADDDKHTLEKRYDTCPVCGQEFDHARFERGRNDTIRADATECRRANQYEARDYVFVHFPEELV